MTPIIAIDPGSSGGFAWRDRDGEFHCAPMPETQGDVLDLLTEIHASCPGLICAIEKVGGFVAGNPTPGSTMFNFGRGVGFIEGILMTRSVPTETVTPQKWQKHVQLGSRGDMEKGEWKNKAKAIAQQRFPGLRVTLKVSDALLILEYKISMTH